MSEKPDTSDGARAVASGYVASPREEESLAREIDAFSAQAVERERAGFEQDERLAEWASAKDTANEYARETLNYFGNDLSIREVIQRLAWKANAAGPQLATLEAENERLREALGTISGLSVDAECYPGDDSPIQAAKREARAALPQTP